MIYEDLQNQFIDVFLLTLGARDAYTEKHSERLSMLAREISLGLNLSSVEIKKIVFAAKLHDIGKIGISDTILLKPDKLTQDEFDIIKTHPEIGADILAKISIFSHIKDYVLYHHEKYDGSGYPSGLKEKNIPLGARIIAIVDTIDAILTRRSYKEPKPIDYAVEELQRCAGTQFDPYIADLAISIINKYKDIFIEDNVHAL